MPAKNSNAADEQNPRTSLLGRIGKLREDTKCSVAQGPCWGPLKPEKQPESSKMSQHRGDLSDS
jgi:hypothetical protein